ncbi:ulp1 protease family, C-terminal catalytic domain-containing protein [Tanacetum coccineum]|uniref:Ulp1 protease family, C-terminal catalytic domain-containing protein n=1 Tax=Tanacetum coccineum TaxID=301880 RepID=A0ABQ5AV09_9ASTR
MGSRIKANEGLSLEVYDAKVSARSRLYLLKTIGSKLAFKPGRYKKFKSIVFGPWLDIRTQEHDNHLINYLLQHQRNVKDPSTDIPFTFDIGPNTIEFGRRDVKGLDLNKLLNNHTQFNKLFDDDDDVHGFVFAFKIWLLETYPNSKTWWVEEKNVIPRVVAWSDGTLFLKNDYDRLFQVRNRLRTLTPSSDEMKQKWWRMSLEYFHNVSKASTSSDGPSKKKKSRVKHKSVVSHTHVRTEVHREVDVRTNVHHDVDEGLSVPDVHHDVEEGLSVPELLKKISDMQRDFQSRITAVEQFVNHHKTSKIGSDSHVTNVFSNSMEFDHHDFGSLTKNPHNRVALMKKITNMEPSCGSDVKARNKESMCVDSSIKTSCATDINANNVHKDSMDFDHDPKVVEQNEFDQNVADKNLIHDFDQTVEWKILLNDEAISFKNSPNFIVEEHQLVSSKNCKVPIAGAEMIAIDALIKIINFDIPKESPIQPMVIETPVEGCKSGETSKSMISETQSHTCDSVKRPMMLRFNERLKRSFQIGKRPAEADWAICGPFFNTFMLGDKKPCCFVDRVTYGVPWFSKYVEKVYFSINAEDNHWILAEFHIRSGVITFYDDLPLKNLIVEDRKWWLDTRQLYADKLPKLLIQSEVMEKKNIDPSNYYISYRLLNNLPLEVSNPTQTGLAYREHLTDFFWKYKIAK